MACRRSSRLVLPRPGPRPDPRLRAAAPRAPTSPSPPRRRSGTHQPHLLDAGHELRPASVAAPSRRAVGAAQARRRAGADGRTLRRARWTSPWRVRLRLHRADRVVGGHHAGRQLARGRRSAVATARAPVVLGPPGPLDVGRAVRAAHHRLRQSDDLAAVDVDTWRSRHRRAGLLAAARLALRRTGADGAAVARPRRDDAAVCPASAPGRLRARPAAGTVLDVPAYSQMAHSRPLPAVGRRRRGVVLADVDLDGARLLRRAAAAVRLPLRARRAPDPWVDYAARETYDAAYEGTGNWPFNTAYAAPARRRRLRHPAPVAARGGDVRRRGHPARRLGLLRCGRAERRPDVGLQRPPGGDRRLHRLGRRRSSTTRPPSPRRVRRIYDRPSSRTPG